MIKYLQPTDKIQEGDLFLNSKGQWEYAKNIGCFVWDEFGRYMRLEGSSLDFGDDFLNLLPAELMEHDYRYEI